MTWRDLEIGILEEFAEVNASYRGYELTYVSRATLWRRRMTSEERQAYRERQNRARRLHYQAHREEILAKRPRSMRVIRPLAERVEAKRRRDRERYRARMVAAGKTVKSYGRKAQCGASEASEEWR